ncbi:hypothetical protein OG579_16965 [Williamsia herbipolensis]|uniref:Helix-turn-helix domain-containing protein n=1 Tax=Williamsia herbipolensis TaxID=1603258 RepID=A0AAU4K020_9NOCA|nr:hypothetical protein [Williamsia herbipolensis]
MGDARKSRRVRGRGTEREAQALQLFLAGCTYEQIAEKVDGYSSASTVCRAITRALKRRADERDELADQALTVILEQLDGVLRGHYLRSLRGDTKAADIVLKVIDRKIRLGGYDTGPHVAVQVNQYGSHLDHELTELVAGVIDAAGDYGLPVSPELRELPEQ